MSKQGRHHHYIPIFYLKQWSGEDGRICEFSKPHDRVKPPKVHPTGTAYMDGLNTVHGLPREEEQYLEDVFYKAADDDAARALRHMFTRRFLAIRSRLLARALAFYGVRSSPWNEREP